MSIFNVVYSLGTRYGKGSYFAKTSNFASRYSQGGSSDKVLFIARVLVGDYTKGEPEYKRPPAKDAKNPASDLYDSCVNKMSDPEMFIIFDNSQVYPEYIVRYS